MYENKIFETNQVIKVLTYKEKVELQQNIKLLKENEHMEILRILINNNIKFTENNNGIFFNLKTLDNNIINEINVFVNFCINNKDLFKKKEIPLKKTTIIKQNDYRDLDSSYKKYLSNNSTSKNFIDVNSENNENSVITKKKDLQKKIKTSIKKNKNKIKMEGIKGRIMNKCKNININNEETEESETIDTNEIDDSDMF